VAYKIPSLGEIIDAMTRDFANRFPNANIARKSDNWLRVGNQAVTAALVHRHVRVIDRDLWPDTASGDELERHAAIRGLDRRPATPAKKANALRLTGTLASAFTLGDLLTHASGLRFQLNESGTIPAALFIDVDVIAVDVGAQTRLAAGETLTFSSPPGGINAKAVLQLALDEDGADEESDGELQTRVLDKIAEPGMGGNAEDFREWAKELAGIFEAYAYPLRQGLGSVHVAALKNGTGAARILSGAENAALLAHLEVERPIGYEDCEVLTVAAEPQNIEVAVLELDGFEYDWDDTVPLVVSSWTSGTRTLKFTTARPSDMQVGDRVVYKRVTATVNSGKAHTIEGFGAADEVVLKDDAELATSPPVATNSVYAGGALTEPVRLAIQAHVDSLGPGRVDSADPTKDFSAPNTSYWEGSLRPSRILGAAQSVEGTVDTDVIVPAAVVNPTNAAPALAVGLATAAQIIVRAKH
jgi:uncharacterized phage protein gp47/JayE